MDKVCQIIEEEQGVKCTKCTTEKLPLTGGIFKNFKEVQKYIKEIHTQLAPLGFDKNYAQYLVTTFGRQTDAIIQTFQKFNPDKARAELLMGKAEYLFCLENEMVANPLDYFIRRSGRLYFDIFSIDKLLDVVFKTHQEWAGTDDAEMMRYKEALEIEIEKHTQVAKIM